MIQQTPPNVQQFTRTSSSIAVHRSDVQFSTSSNNNVEINMPINSISEDSSHVQPRFRSLLPYFKLHIRICKLLGCAPFEWDDKSQRAIPIRSKYLKWLCNFQVIIHGLYASVMASYFFTKQSLNANEMGQNIMSTIFLLVFIVSNLFRWTFWAKQDEAVYLWNSFLTYEEKSLPPPDPKKPYDLIAKTLLTLGIVTSGGLAAFIATILLVDPCQPPHLGHMILKRGIGQCIVPSYAVQTAFLLFDVSMWATMISSGVFYVFNCTFLLLRCLDSYLQLLIKSTRIGLRSDNTIQKKNNNKSCNGNDTERNVFEYKRVILLGRAYDSVLQTLFLPSLFAIGILAIIIPLYTCIKLHKVIPMPGFAMFPLITCDGFSVLYISQVAAKVCVLSKKYVQLMKKSKRPAQTPLERRISKSLDFMKVRFGSANFVDELTPLNFLNFSLTQTVSLMLIESK